MTTLISNKGIHDIMKLIKSREESGLLIKAVKKTITNETKEQKDGFLGLLLDTVGASLSKKQLAGKGTITAGEGMIRAGQDLY